MGLSLIIACEVIGAVSVPLSPADLAETDGVMSRCGFLCADTIPPDAPSGLGVLPLTPASLARIARIPVGTEAPDLLDMRRPDDDIVKIARTSGSTGRPKLMGVTRRQSDTQIAQSARERALPGFHYNFIALHNFVPHWVFIESAMALHAGGTVVMSGFETVYRDLDRFPGSHMGVHPLDIPPLLAHRPAGRVGPWFGLLNVKGGGITPEQRRTLLEQVVTDLHHSYGTTETFRICVIDDDGVGHLCPDAAVRIVGPDGTVLGPGQTGVIEAWTPSIVDGYLDDEATTRQAFIDGWYRTSDVGFMPAPDRLVLLGRADDMLNIGGIKCAPEPLEATIRGCPGVADVALVAVPNSAGVDELAAALVLEPSADVAAIHRHIAIVTAPHAASVQVHLVPSVPRTESGKLRRPDIRRLVLSIGN